MALSLAICGLPALWAEAGVQGPVSGFVLDRRSHAIRAINGIPGASTLGEPLDIGLAVDRAVFPAQGDPAIIFSGGGAFLVRGLRQTTPAVLRLSLGPSPSSAVFNVTGTAAVFYSESPRRVQVVTGLGGDPVYGEPIDISGLPGGLRSMALDAGASSILLAMEDSAAGGVYLLRDGAGADRAPRFLFSSPSPAAMIYLNGDRDALVADQALNEIRMIRDVNASAEVSLVATGKDGVSTPIGLHLSGDGKSVLAANAGSSTLTAHSLTAEAPAIRIPLPASPSRLDRLDRGAVLILSELGSGPLYLVDEADGRQVYFVPVD
jgi:hypothetical protein